MGLLWKPMPYSRLRECGFLNAVDYAAPSNWIAALKIFIVIEIKSEVNEDGEYCASLTYPQLQKLTGMSRQLICNGLQKLNSFKMIVSEGKKNKRHHILFSCKGSTIKDPITKKFSKLNDGAWCKMPVKGFVGEDGRILSFLSMNNRGLSDLNSLRLFIYLLSIRRKGFVAVVVTEATLMKNLRLTRLELKLAISYMLSMGLIEKVKSRLGDFLIVNKDTAYAFLPCGWDVLEWDKRASKTDGWKDSLIEEFDSWV